MITLQEHLNESLYGGFNKLKAAGKLKFQKIKGEIRPMLNKLGEEAKELLSSIKDRMVKLANELKSQSLVISATTVEEYNSQCDELMKICSEGEDRIESLKVYFVKNSDPDFGDFTIYIVADEVEQKTYKTVVDRENNWPGTIAFKEILDEVFVKNTYYTIYFDKAAGMPIITMNKGKNIVKEFDAKYKDLGFRLSPRLNKWTQALKIISELF